MHHKNERFEDSPATKQSRWLQQEALVCTYFAVFVVNEDVAGAVGFEVGDLEAVGVSDLLRLKGGVDGVHFDHGFGHFRLWHRQKSVRLNTCMDLAAVYLYIGFLSFNWSLAAPSPGLKKTNMDPSGPKNYGPVGELPSRIDEK